MSKAQELVSFMDNAVLRMPYEMVIGSPISQHQFYVRVQSLLDRLESASSEQQAAQQDSPDLLPPMGIRNDRDMLNYLMGAFDSEVNYCVRCGCEEETKDMDSANFLREYLAAARASNGGKA